MSIGLPVFNGARYLEATLAALLAQDYGNYELIISDNASEDDTERICRATAERDPRVRYHRNSQNIGAIRNFNQLVTLARGTYFGWAAHDDMWKPSFVRRCVEALEGRPEAVLAHSWVDFVDPDGHPYATPAKGFLTELDGLRERFHTSIYDTRAPLAIYGVLRRDALQRTHLFPEVIGCDIVLLAELALLGPFVEVPEVLFTYRTGGFNQGPSYRKRLLNAAHLQSKIGSTLFPYTALGLSCLQVAARADQPVPQKLRLAADVLRWYFVDVVTISNLARVRNLVRHTLSVPARPNGRG